MEPGRDASEIGLGAAPAYAGTIRHVRSDTLGSNVSATSATSATEMLARTPLDALDAGVFYDAVPLGGADGRCLGGSGACGSCALHARRRFSQELGLLRRQWRVWLLCLATGVYGGSMVFRNLAFYRYRAGPRLTQDLGFDLLPEWQGHLTDSPMCALQAVLVGACAMSFVPRRAGPPAAYAVNIVRRWGVMIAMGNTLRFLTYMATTLPGSAKHCLPSNPNLARDQPKTVRDILFRITVDGVGDGKSGTYNCGDLTFSGHILMTMTSAFCCLRYAPAAYRMTRRAEACFTALVWAAVAMQCILTVAARNHYTMDVVISAYLTPLLWSFYTTSMEPEDMQPAR